MGNRLNTGEQKTLTIRAREEYSAETIGIKKGEQYHIWCESKQIWVDFFIPATPDGYNNPLGNWVGLRLKGVKCMCLCGVYNKEESTGFAIGKDNLATCHVDGELSFYANDVAGYYWNNWGKIRVEVKRVK